MRFAAIVKLRQIWPLRWLCATFEVTCAGFYAWLKRPQSQRAYVDEGLMTHIHRSFLESDRTYGARRVRRDLRDWGHRCGIHRVERLMRRAELVARPRDVVCPLILVRDLSIDRSQRPRPAVRRGRGELQMGCRLHLSVDGGRLVVCGSGH